LSEISATFTALNGRPAYIPYICAGDPDKEFSLSLAKRLCDSGADILEIGIPFSDPIADGPVIQEAMQRSLKSGFHVGDVFRLIERLRSQSVPQPVVAMTYYNPILKMGPDKFCRSLSECGGDALLVVDLPPEESSSLLGMARDNELDMIRLVAPSTTDDRLEYILSEASGFVYVVSVAGTTGERESLPESAISLIHRVSGKSRLPVALGFGISMPEHVRQAISAGASAVVEGSKLITLYSGHLDDRKKALESVERHAREMMASSFSH